MEKHTMQDGPIPLSGLSLLVVCRQWGSVSIPASGKTREEIVVTFPITVNAVVNVQSSCRSPVGITRAGDETRSTITIVRGEAWTAGSLTVDWQVICK